MNLNHIIPPDDHTHRNGFTNEPLVDTLDDADRSTLERALIARLQAGTTDLLVVETLAYLKAQAAVPEMQAFLARCPEPVTRLGAADALYRLTRDGALLGVALEAFRCVEAHQDAYQVYALLPCFYYLSSFEGVEVDSVLAAYAHHANYLVSYNAKQAMHARTKR